APDPVDAAPVQRVRLRYRKVGPARFIGTREIGNVFLRAARRAGLPLAFSRGHHPMPRLSFSPAIPLGFSSDDEYLDVDLTAPVEPAAVAAGFAAELPEGLEPVTAVEVPCAGPSIDAGVVAFVYAVDLASLDEPPTPERVADAVARFERAAVFPLRKRGKSGERTVDARRFVPSLVQTGPRSVSLELTIGPEGTIRPVALLGELLALAPDALPTLRVHKLATRFRAAAA
ncbi:MAG TPA: TIGR03936 family radical SAM-associated protein, partial [Candidatus Binatia bacterium]|nr:TIGR03936 family radical SAM-associated protein [Candidatus Binatia bacterium]